MSREKDRIKESHAARNAERFYYKRHELMVGQTIVYCTTESGPIFEILEK